tara:strand:+ start:72 stop:458 length:387 start_codon:yes stop_codon:yes gene_type:complete
MPAPPPSSVLPSTPSLGDSGSADVEASGDQQQQLSGGALVGIVVGVGAACLLAAMGTAYYFLTTYGRQRRVRVVTLGGGEGGGSPATAVTSKPLFKASNDGPVGLAAPDKVRAVEGLPSEKDEQHLRL